MFLHDMTSKTVPIHSLFLYPSVISPLQMCVYALHLHLGAVTEL